MDEKFMLKATDTVREFLDIGYVVVARPAEYHVDYWVFEAYDCGHGLTFDSGSCEKTQDINFASYAVQGFVKWDHCSNWNFCEDGMMMHFCGKEIANLGSVLKRCYDMTKELLPKWDTSFNN